MRASILKGLVALAALLPVTGSAYAQCSSGAIGMSRTVQVDTTGGPRFGHVQYAGPQFLQPGEVVLTFDDGPHRHLTESILATLDQHCVKATFFLVGQRAMMYPALVREVARRGHTVATHTWSHRDLRKIGASAATNEIELGISAVQRALGKPAAPFFRFPYLSDPSYAISHLGKRNTAIFSIDVDSQDFRTRSASVVMRNVKRQLKAKGRGIILFHDIQPSTAGALGALLGDLKAEGYKVVHLVPSSSQTTLADYDRRVGGQKLGDTSSASLAVSQRSAVNPAWEPRATPPPQGAGAASGVPQVAAVEPAPTPQPSAPPQQPARRPASDWRSTVFTGN